MAPLPGRRPRVRWSAAIARKSMAPRNPTACSSPPHGKPATRAHATCTSGTMAFDAGKEPLPWWEQVLWRYYDATEYVANFQNTRLVAYSGEIDPQKQSADVMVAAAQREGFTFEHLIGPGVAHKYEPETKKK